MKNTLLIIFIVISKLAVAQSSLAFKEAVKNGDDYTIGTEISDTITIRGEADKTLELKCYISNLTDDLISTKIKRDTISFLTGCYDELCWGGMCIPLGAKYSEFTSKPQDMDAKKELLSNGIFHYSGKGETGTSVFRYILISNIGGKEVFEDTVVVKYITTTPSTSSILNTNTQEISKPYPNPATDNFSIGYKFENPESTELVLLNITGKIIETKRVFSLNGEVTFDTGRLLSGIYFLNTVQNGIVTNSEKIIVNK